MKTFRAARVLGMCLLSVQRLWSSSQGRVWSNGYRQRGLGAVSVGLCRSFWLSDCLRIRRMCNRGCVQHLGSRCYLSFQVPVPVGCAWLFPLHNNPVRLRRVVGAMLAMAPPPLQYVVSWGGFSGSRIINTHNHWEAMQAKAEIVCCLVLLHFLRRSVCQQCQMGCRSSSVGSHRNSAEASSSPCIFSLFKSMQPGVTAFSAIAHLSPILHIRIGNTCLKQSSLYLIQSLLLYLKIHF